jgi:16S rRNA (guanine527-N7)-methyltransferase
MPPETRGVECIADSITLEGGVRELGLRLSERQRERLARYLDLLQRWNRVYNLTAVRDPQAMLEQHVLDTLAILPPLLTRGLVRWSEPEDPASSGLVRAADLGSGAGLPGLILAMLCTDMHLTSIEPVGKKCAFQQQVVSELGLTDVEIIQKRAEQVCRPVDLIFSRALTSLAALIQIAVGLIGPGTRLIAMKGRLREIEIELKALPAGWSAEVVQVAVPGLQTERHLVIMNRT